MEGALTTLLEAFWFLQTKSLEEAQQALEQIRASTDISAVLKYLNMQRQLASHTSHGQMAWQEFGRTQQESSPKLPDSGGRRLTVESVESSLSKASHETHRDDLWSDDLYRHQGSDGYLKVLKHKDTLPGLKAGLQSFKTYTALVFYVYKPEELEQSIQDVLAGLNQVGADWILEAQDNEIHRRRSMLSELFAIAALGLQHIDEPISQEPSFTADTPGAISDVDGLSRTFYQISKALLDETIEYSPYNAMKLCTMFGIFNVVEHSTVALAFTNLGLTFAMDYGLFGTTAAPGLTRADFLSHKKTIRTLAMLRKLV